MKTATAIKVFMKKQGTNPTMNYQPVDVKEIKAFKDSCTPDEYHDFGRQACELIGETFEE